MEGDLTKRLLYSLHDKQDRVFLTTVGKLCTKNFAVNFYRKRLKYRKLMLGMFIAAILPPVRKLSSASEHIATANLQMWYHIV